MNFKEDLNKKSQITKFTIL